jgi:hypothetical protein
LKKEILGKRRTRVERGEQETSKGRKGRSVKGFYRMSGKRSER